MFALSKKCERLLDTFQAVLLSYSTQDILSPFGEKKTQQCILFIDIIIDLDDLLI